MLRRNIASDIEELRAGLPSPEELSLQPRRAPLLQKTSSAGSMPLHGQSSPGSDGQRERPRRGSAESLLLGRQHSDDDGIFSLLRWIESRRLMEGLTDAELNEWWAEVVRPFPWLLLTVATLDAEHVEGATLVDISAKAPMVK